MRQIKFILVDVPDELARAFHDHLRDFERKHGVRLVVEEEPPQTKIIYGHNDSGKGAWFPLDHTLPAKLRAFAGSGVVRFKMGTS